MTKLRVIGETPAPADRAAWLEAGRALSAQHSEASWEFADWLRAGREQFGREAMREAAAATGASAGKISNYCAVSEAYPDFRRRKSLEFSHHLEVARLVEADRDRLLDAAEAERWSRSVLREAAREVRDAKLDRLRAENERLKAELAALAGEPGDRRRALLGAQRLKDDLKSDCKAFVVASRRIAERLEEAAGSPTLVALHGNARRSLVKWIRAELSAAGESAAHDATIRSLPAVARLAGGDQTNGGTP